jgi:hypothetical protein
MALEESLDISRRQFLTAGGLTVAGACLVPSYLGAQTDGQIGGLVEVRSRKPQQQKSRSKPFAAILVSSWALVETSPFLPALTESC